MMTMGEIDETDSSPARAELEDGIVLKKSDQSDASSSDRFENQTRTESTDTTNDGDPLIHQSNPEPMSEETLQKNRDYRKKMNRNAREVVSDSIHKGVKLIVHRPEYDVEQQLQYDKISKDMMPIVREIARKTMPLLEHEVSVDYRKNQFYGTKFQAESTARKDFRYFSKKTPPSESPSLVVGIRVDESASMSAFGRLDAAKRAVLAVYEFCRICNIPVLIYGDTADVSKMEQMSIYAYTDYDNPDPYDRYRLMGIKGRSNNRDGMALRIIADRLATSNHQTKLIISISDGQPKAMDNYTGSYATRDMQQTIAEYERKGVTFIAAAIGQDKEVISEIYGADRFLDLTNLQELPVKLVRLISRYL
ncbi:nitric oxide reductase activation protein NorD [Paenibacillus sp. Marseille-Q4541]|uniref:vWA domain-containing protein n=1 Tax=Paenibacillus sp. Marseille-Q4541 TaxID=2831522 RepID=UPI002019E1BF|nr:nitric oxide reductase activation protein NorD [Paenibacillus sp. Marseille-Q4541]